MNRSLLVVPVLLCAIGCLTCSDLPAQDGDASPQETVLFPVQSGDARSLVDPIRMAFGNDVTVSMLPQQQILMVRLPRRDRDELIEMLQRLSPAPHTVRLEVFLLGVESALDQDAHRQLSGPIGDVRKKIRELKTEKGLVVLNEADLSVLEQTESMLDVVRSVPIVTGTSNSGGRVTNSYEQIDVGTKIRTRVRVVEDHVLMDFDLSRSSIDSTDTDEVSLPKTGQLTHQATLRIKNRHAHLVGRISGETKMSMYLVVAVEILDDGAANQTVRFRSAQAPSDAVSNVSSSSAARAKSTLELRKSIEILFRQADTDRDGKISAEEFSRMKMRPNGLERVRGADGSISRNVFVSWLTNRANQDETSRSSSARRPRRVRSETSDRKESDRSDDSAR